MSKGGYFDEKAVQGNMGRKLLYSLDSYVGYVQSEKRKWFVNLKVDSTRQTEQRSYNKHGSKN